MGFNSTILILNDNLHLISKNPNFGEQVSDQLALHCSNKQYPYAIGGFKVIAQHHADAVSIILVGGNTSRVIGMKSRGDGSWARKGAEGTEGIVRLLKDLCSDYGYRLVKMSKAQKQGQSWKKPYSGSGFSY